MTRLTRYGMQQTGKSVMLSIQVGSAVYQVEVRIQASISSQTYQPQPQPQPPLYSSHSHFQTYQPRESPLFLPQHHEQPYQSQLPQVEPVVTTAHTLRWKGQPGKEGDVTIRDNNIEIPAGNINSRVFKVVVHNYSNKTIVVQLDPLQSPFNCSYTDVVVRSYGI